MNIRPEIILQKQPRRVYKHKNWGYIPPAQPWVYAPQPVLCGHCGQGGELHLRRIEPNNDGWSCFRCGWTVYDPGLDDDDFHSSRSGNHQRIMPGEKYD